MQFYKIELLRKIKSHLRNGGLIAYPTEFCYGLGCDPFNVAAVKKLIQLKQRDPDKGLIVIASDIAQLKSILIPLNKVDQERIKQYWPGFYTLIMKVKPTVPQILLGKHQGLALRVSSHQLVQNLCTYLQSPLVSTSANLAQQYPLRDYNQCQQQFSSQVLVLPGMVANKKQPSTILDWHSLQVLR